MTVSMQCNKKQPDKFVIFVILERKMSSFWRNIDLKASLVPDDIILKKDCVVVNEGIKEIKDARVFFREALPPSDSFTLPINILLLHGQMFSSKTWLDLGTIHLLASMGYRTVAVDLPGYANTPAVKVFDKADFLQSLLISFNLQNPVIVSPSMSGSYTLPYLVRHWKNLAGYIPVAPVGYEILEELPPTNDYNIKSQVCPSLHGFLHDPVPDLSFIQTPTMVVFGEKDRSRSSALLNLLPHSQCQEIPNARHPAYLDDPNLWHRLLYNFLAKVSEKCQS